MTDTITTTRTRLDTPVSARRRGAFPGRLLRWIAYDARLVSLGVQTMADAVTGEHRTEAGRLDVVDRGDRRTGAFAGGRVEQLPRSEGPQPVASGQSAERVGSGSRGAGRVRPGGGELFGFGLVTSVLGVVSWFLGMLLVMAVVRGAFYGFVEDGPFGAGTWGGPTKAGAWAVHAAISVPIIAGLIFVFRGIGWLHGALVRRLYGVAGGWVLPATISVCTGGLWLIWSWIQQL
jgi:hypothetical protein